ncbi:MAG: OmpA family protein [Phycisphaerales bacterium]|nr:OmpA family protein [Phycisphaerales bacterium]
MALKKRIRKELSCPLWLATYGDLVTNVLVFFVLLLSMSEIKKDDRFIDFMQAIREAFGYVGGLESVPYEQVLSPKNVELAKILIVPVQPKEWAKAPDPGIRNKEQRVTYIRREDKFAIGGKFRFEELSATLGPDNQALLAEYIEKLRGYETQIELRGHSSRFPVAGSPFRDHFDLSLARARAVAEALMAQGVAPERIVVVGVGTNEPVRPYAYSAAERSENDRVEVLQVHRTLTELAPGEGEPTGIE